MGRHAVTEYRYRADQLRAFAAKLLAAAGLPGEQAEAVAGILLEGDLLGKTTHGLQLMPPYLKDVESGRMRHSGEPEVVSDAGPVLVWDGGYLPGPWLVLGLMEALGRRVEEDGVGIGLIRRCHHIGALQAYLKPVTDRGLMAVLTASDPREESVAPFGGRAARYSPNPLAVGIPTQEGPILVDISASTTANGVVNRRRAQGRKMPGPWLVDPQGKATDDPEVRFADPAGALLPLGGADLGYKGFGLGLFIEALTAGLGGYGRKDRPDNWGCSVYVQIMDPARFGGALPFTQEMSFLSEYCRTTPVAEGAPPVRMPGDTALARREKQLAEGVELFPGILDGMAPWAEKFTVPAPEPV
jgi:LDH2 family malate/lactate/ureidoglycolate dehydrogenase